MIIDILFVGLVVVLLVAIYKLKFKKDAQHIGNTTVPQPAPQPRVAAQEQHNQEEAAPRWARNRVEQQPQSPESEDESDKEEGTFADRRKQLRKEEKARLKQQRKEALEQHLELQRQNKEKKEQEELEKERLEEEKRKKEEEYYKMLSEEEEKRKKAEYDKWKGMFTVEDSGKAKQTAEVEEQRRQELLKNIQETIKKSKLCLLEDLSHKFKLTTKQVIVKIKQLENDEKVRGIFDQRGKYMMIEDREWEAIRNYMEVKGRVKKTDIMQECARIIRIPDEVRADEEILGLIEKETQAS